MVRVNRCLNVDLRSPFILPIALKDFLPQKLKTLKSNFQAFLNLKKIILNLKKIIQNLKKSFKTYFNFLGNKIDGVDMFWWKSDSRVIGIFLIKSNNGLVNIQNDYLHQNRILNKFRWENLFRASQVKSFFFLPFI